MKYIELLARYSAVTAHQPLVAGAKGGLRYSMQRLAEFIGPDLAPSDEIQQPTHPQVEIISASGAAGKSTLANELAVAKRAPIWDLAHADAVGGNSMAGQIIESFGPAGAANVYAALSRGEMFFVIDALDEATMKSNEAGFEAFIRNIASIAKTAKQKIVRAFRRNSDGSRHVVDSG